MSRFRSKKGRFGGGGHEAEGDGDVVRATPMPFMRSLDLRGEAPKRQKLNVNVKPLHLVLAAAIPLAAIVVGLLYVSASSKADDAKAKRDVAASQLEKTQQRAASLTSQTELLDAIASAGEATLTSTVAASLSGRVAWDRVVRSASRVRPEGTWFSSVSGRPVEADAEGGADEGQAPEAGELTLSGFSLDHTRIAKLIARLDTLRDAKAVRLKSTSTTTIGEKEVIQFDIVVSVRGSR